MSDTNFPLQAVEALRGLGHDVLTALEAGQANQAIPDAQVLEFATGLGRALLTLNRWQFIALHSHASQHAGIVVCHISADIPDTEETRAWVTPRRRDPKRGGVRCREGSSGRR